MLYFYRFILVALYFTAAIKTFIWFWTPAVEAYGLTHIFANLGFLFVFCTAITWAFTRSFAPRRKPAATPKEQTNV